MRSTGAVFTDVTMYRPLYTGRMGGERGTHAGRRTQTRARSSSRPHTRVCSGGCEHGRSAHTERDIYIFTQLCTTLARNVDRFSQFARMQRATIRTHPHTRTHARAQWRRRYGSKCAYNVEKVYACVRRTFDKLGGRGSSMALEHTCVSIGDPSTYALIRIATYACARARAETSAAPPRATAAHASTTDRAQSAAVRAGPERRIRRTSS